MDVSLYLRFLAIHKRSHTGHLPAPCSMTPCWKSSWTFQGLDCMCERGFQVQYGIKKSVHLNYQCMAFSHSVQSSHHREESLKASDRLVTKMTTNGHRARLWQDHVIYCRYKLGYCKGHCIESMEWRLKHLSNSFYKPSYGDTPKASVSTTPVNLHHKYHRGRKRILTCPSRESRYNYYHF